MPPGIAAGRLASATDDANLAVDRRYSGSGVISRGPAWAQLAGLLKGASAETARWRPHQPYASTGERLLAGAVQSGRSMPEATQPLPGADLKATLLHLAVNLQQQPFHPQRSRSWHWRSAPWKQSVGGPAQQSLPLATRCGAGYDRCPDLGALLRLTAALLVAIQHQPVAKPWPIGRLFRRQQRRRSGNWKIPPA